MSGFVGGLFSGFGGVMGAAQSYQQYQQNQYSLDAAAANQRAGQAALGGTGGAQPYGGPQTGTGIPDTGPAGPTVPTAPPLGEHSGGAVSTGAPAPVQQAPIGQQLTQALGPPPQLMQNASGSGGAASMMSRTGPVLGGPSTGVGGAGDFFGNAAAAFALRMFGGPASAMNPQASGSPPPSPQSTEAPADQGDPNDPNRRAPAPAPAPPALTPEQQQGRNLPVLAPHMPPGVSRGAPTPAGQAAARGELPRPAPPPQVTTRAGAPAPAALPPSQLRTFDVPPGGLPAANQQPASPNIVAPGPLAPGMTTPGPQPGQVGAPTGTAGIPAGQGTPGGPAPESVTPGPHPHDRIGIGNLGLPQRTTPPAPAPEQGAPGPQASLADRILRTFSPISTAQAAEPVQGSVGGQPPPGFDAQGNPLPGGVTTSVTQAPSQASSQAPSQAPPPTPVAAEVAPPGAPQPGHSEVMDAAALSRAGVRPDTPPPGGQTEIAAQGTGPGGQPTVTSEQTATYPPVETRSLQLLQSRYPQQYQMLENAVQNYGHGTVSLAEAASVFFREGRSRSGELFSLNPGISPTGARGPMQMQPATFGEMNAVDGGNRNIDNPQDNMDMAVRYLHALTVDQKYAFPPNSPQLNYAYRAGPGAAQNVARYGLEAERRANPRSVEDVARMYNQSPDQFTSDGQKYFFDNTNRLGLSIATRQQFGDMSNPDNSLRWVTQAGALGMGVTHLWQSALTTAVSAAIAHGNYNAIPMIQNYFTMQMHMGAIGHMAQADVDMTNGNLQGAINELAMSHAFFPDGSYVRFGLTNDGKIWAQQFSEDGQHRPLTRAFEVTQDGIRQQMLKLQNPQNYLQTLQEYQSNNARIAHELVTSESIAEGGGTTGRGLGTRGTGALTPAQAITQEATRQRAIDTRMSRDYGENGAYPPPTPDDPDYAQKARTWGRQAEMDKALRVSGEVGSDQQSSVIASGLANNRYDLLKTDKGFSIVDKGDREGKSNYGNLSEEMGRRLLRTMSGASMLPPPGSQAAPQRTSAIGAGANSMAAMSMGMNTTLAGEQNQRDQQNQQVAETAPAAILQANALNQQRQVLGIG